MKPCPHFLKRFAVLAAASLILSAVTLSASAAAAPVKYEEKRSTVTTVDGAQKKKDLAVTVEYQVGSTSIRAYTVEKDEVIGVSKDNVVSLWCRLLLIGSPMAPIPSLSR